MNPFMPKNVPWLEVLKEAIASGKSGADVAREQRVSRAAVSHACKVRDVKLKRTRRQPERTA